MSLSHTAVILLPGCWPHRSRIYLSLASTTVSMSIIAQHAQARVRKKRLEGEVEEMMKEPDTSSPMKSVLGSLTLQNQNQVQPVSKSHNTNSNNNQISRASKVPQSIEEVPFR